MSPADPIAALVRAFGLMAVVTRPEIEQLLGVGLSKVKENRFFDFFAAEGLGAPFADADLRLKKDGSGHGLLVLNVAESQEVAESALDLGQYGPPTHLDVNPQIPPEGTVTHAFTLGSAEVRFQLTAASHRLRLLAVEWGSKR